MRLSLDLRVGYGQISVKVELDYGQIMARNMLKLQPN